MTAMPGISLNNTAHNGTRRLNMKDRLQYFFKILRWGVVGILALIITLPTITSLTTPI